jgi:SNF2 family DNA or RNA helicase
MKLSMKPKRDTKTSKVRFGFDSIINYDWQLAIGDEPLSEEEFEALVSLKEPLVRVRGQWVEVKKEDIEAAIKFFKSRGPGEMRLGEALRLSLAYGETDTGLPISGFAASRWLSELLDRLSGEATIKELAQPDDFVGELRPYQAKGLSWLAFLRQ